MVRASPLLEREMVGVYALPGNESDPATVVDPADMVAFLSTLNLLVAPTCKSIRLLVEAEAESVTFPYINVNGIATLFHV